MTSPTKLILKKSSVTTKKPVAGDLQYGELAINYADGIIYYKNSSNAIKSFRDLSSNDSAITAGDTLTLTSTDDTTAEAPNLILYRNSSSPNTSDNLGRIVSKGRNDNSQDIEVAAIETKTTNLSDGAENGKMVFQVMNNGTMQSRLDFRGQARTRIFNQPLELSTGVDLIFEGASSGVNETTVTVVDPTQDNTITLPDKTGTVAMTSDISGEAVVMAIALG